MNDRSPQEEAAQQAVNEAGAQVSSPECSIFRADYEPSPSEATQASVFAARRKMAVAHEAALKVLGIAQMR